MRRRALWLGGIVLLAGTALAGCRARESAEVEVEVRTVTLDQAARSPVVLLQDKTQRVALPIWVGPTEAQAIAMQMDGVIPPRPMTHDLMKLALEQTGVEFEKVLIHDLKDSTYYARIYLRSGNKLAEVDSRPSDAIALAVRFHKPIFVSRALLRREVTIDLRQATLSEGMLTRAGITMQDLTEDLAGYFGLPPGRGVLVSDVTRDAQAAVRRGDIIVEIDGESVGDVRALQGKLDALQSGGHADLSVRRGSNHLHVEFIAE